MTMAMIDREGRRALRVHIKGDLEAGLKRVAAALKAAVA